MQLTMKNLLLHRILTHERYVKFHNASYTWFDVHANLQHSNTNTAILATLAHGKAYGNTETNNHRFTSVVLHYRTRFA